MSYHQHQNNLRRKRKAWRDEPESGLERFMDETYFSRSSSSFGVIAKVEDNLTALFFIPAVAIFGICLGGLFVAEAIALLHRRIRREKYHEAMRPKRSLRKPHSDNPPPSPQKLTAQWDRVHDSLDEMLRFGSLLVDLEASDLIDNSPILNYDTSDGIPEIVARRPGLKGWLAEHCPHIGYKTAMRYKSLFQKSQKAPGKAALFIRESPFISDLSENLRKELKLGRHALRRPRRPRANHGRLPFPRPGSGDPGVQPLIHTFRAQTRAALQTLTPAQRRRFISSLHAFTKELGNAP